MIPKRLIFIWLGSEIPDYGKFCIENFKKVNPDFEIMIVNEKDIEHSQNQNIIDLKKILNSGQKSVYTYMFERPYAKKYLQSDIGKITSFSDALRLYLLNKYGGIYLDLDTFPVKKFDEKILSYDPGFVVNHDRQYCDFFFMGFRKGMIDEGYINFYPHSAKHLFKKEIHRLKMDELLRTIFQKKLKYANDRFYALSLQIGETAYDKDYISEYYIDHFRKNSWR